MVLVSTYCAQLLNINVRSLREKLAHPADREAVLRMLKGKKVRTTYTDRNGFKKTFFIDSLTRDGAAYVMAYGRLPRPYNINIAAHFYARHRIRLHNPYMPCVVEHPGKGEDRFYPMELVEIVEDDTSPFPDANQTWFSRIFTEIRERSRSPKSVNSDDTADDDEDNHYLDTGRAQLSQENPKPSHVRY
uniref:PAZ domain-containing protein n=1 Tax=Globodera rostochiensis TaxID=31243 RepID=A0A914I439_GLORO